MAKYVTGIGMKYEPSNYDLIGVWEANNLEGDKGKEAYRMINLQGIREVIFDGIRFVVKE